MTRRPYPDLPPADDLGDERLDRVVEHPDGWYWIAPDGHQQFGPFDSMEAVLADMDTRDGEPDAGPDSGQTLAATERALGQLDWIDPETGALAEDTHLRAEDH
jgi:hypothetical protein